MKMYVPIVSAMLLVLLLLCLGCTTVPSVAYEPPEFADFSTMNWIEAFDAMHDKIAQEYAFTELRGIDWTQKKRDFRPLIEKAWEAQDMRQYYIGLRSYLFSIPDGHVALIKGNHFSDDGLGLYKEEVGGGFGFTLMVLDDGRLIANWVSPNGKANEVGMKVGAEILRWNEKEGIIALKETATLWSVLPQATTASRTYEQSRFLVRAPIGAIRSITFQNPDDTVISTLLEAIDDDFETLKRTEVYGKGFLGVPIESFIEAQLLQEHIGYIKLYGEGNKRGEVPTVTQFKQKLEEFEKNHVQSLIVDLRGNMGGADAMAAAILGFFYEEITFYEYTSWYNSITKEFEIVQFDEETEEIIKDIGLNITPASTRFRGEVIALINHGCISSGEGIAMGIQNLQRGETLGFRGTNGSFGMVGGPLILMPGEYAVMYPIGRSLDGNKTIQIDSNGYEGGILPSITIPMTYEHALAIGSGLDVELAYALHILRTNNKEIDHE